MKYQLVLQFPAGSIADYDELIAIEDLLIEELDGRADVDGHDCGSGEMNIFIITDEAKGIFDCVKPLLAKRKNFEKLVAAYREVDGEQYTTIWPENSRKPFTVK